MNFAASRKQAFVYLQRFYTVRRLPYPAGPKQDAAEVWWVEVEVLRNSRLDVMKLEVKLLHDFPLSLPVITVKRPSVKELVYPLNINTEGIVCIADTTTTTANVAAPGEMVKECVQRAINILEGDQSTAEASYSVEFIAYWEGRYPGEPAVDRRVLSLVPEDAAELTSVMYVSLIGTLGPFTGVIYDEPASFAALASTLEAKGLRYKEVPTFYLGEPNLARPPFQMMNRDVARLIKSLGAGDAFEKYLRKNPKLPVTTFSKKINGRHLIFGWYHKPLIANRSGQYHARKTKAFLPPREYLRQHGHAYVERFSPEGFTQSRLERRTAGDYKASRKGKPLKLLVAGLGSVGSQLAGLLGALDWEELRLIDPDVLAVENLKRHLLGISWVGYRKVDGLRALFLDKHPLGTVKVKTSSLVHIARHDQAFLNDCNYLISCTGDFNAETWLDVAQQEGEITRPTFYLWVEPYLAGGHCVFINGKDGARRQDLFENHFYRHNIISVAEHENRTFTQKEAGCQTSYIPFSNAPLMLFLTRLLPELIVIMQESDHPSCRLTWVGDLTAIQELGIETTDVARATGSFNFVKINLI